MAWVESFEGHTIEATKIIDAGDKVFVAILQQAAPAGADGRGGPLVVGLTFREGVPTRCKIFPEHAQALEAAGLSG